MKNSRHALLVIYALFFLSGTAALVYEISWARQLGLLLGHTAQAASTVLAGFFAGMALGYALAGWWASRTRPLVGYGVAEIAAGLWALLVPLLLAVIHRQNWFDGMASGGVATRAALSLLVLLPATAALGATLPLVAEYLSRDFGDGRRNASPSSRVPPAIAWLRRVQSALLKDSLAAPHGKTTKSQSTNRLTIAYALNTLGAVTGVVAATAVLIVAVGVVASSYLAAGLSIFCGLAALLIEVLSAPGNEGVDSAINPAAEPSSVPPAPSGTLAGWLAMAALIGFVTLALEVLYTRLFSLIFHNSTYTFGAVVAVFLLALALGSLLVALLGNRRNYSWLAAFGCGAGALAVPCSVLLFLHRTGLEYFNQGESLAGYLAAALGLVALVVLPPITLLGMVLPATWGAARGGTSARTVGLLTAGNTLAATLGSLAAGFVLLPLAGLWGAFAVVSVLALLGAAAWLVARRKLLASAGMSALVGLAVVSVLIYSATARERVYERTKGRHWKLLAHWEGPYGWTDVIQDDGPLPHRRLRQNVHYGLGSDGRSTQREYLQAHLPLLLHPSPGEVALLGLGTGLTAAPVTVHQEVKSAVVVELIPEVVEAARLFEESNLHVLDDPKVEVVVDDARHWLLTTDRRFDVIISDLFVPWESETGYLYTVEHYRVARSRLKPDGLFCQWLALYQMGPRELELIADSFAEVFPHTSLWWGRISPVTPMIALVGSEQPLALPDAAGIDARLALLGETTRGKRDVYLGSAERLLRLKIGRWPRRADVPLNTDEHPRVEFLAPASHRSRETLNKAKLVEYFDRVLARLPPGMVAGDGPPAEVSAARHAWQRGRLSPD